MTELELAIENTKQFNDYSKLNSAFRLLNDNDKERLIVRLRKWRKDNFDYFTSGELCGIDHVINMFIAGKI